MIKNSITAPIILLRNILSPWVSTKKTTIISYFHPRHLYLYPCRICNSVSNRNNMKWKANPLKWWRLELVSYASHAALLLLLMKAKSIIQRRYSFFCAEYLIFSFSKSFFSMKITKKSIPSPCYRNCFSLLSFDDVGCYCCVFFCSFVRNVNL